VVDGKLHREFAFTDFVEAFGFKCSAALVAQAMDHHPDWSNSWNRVVIGIVNHSAGGVTQQCLDFAIAVEGIYRVTADPAMTPVD
jgi:4a-hydroxytetrahydrobiopterin dehydratase